MHYAAHAVVLNPTTLAGALDIVIYLPILNELFVCCGRNSAGLMPTCGMRQPRPPQPQTVCIPTEMLDVVESDTPTIEFGSAPLPRVRKWSSCCAFAVSMGCRLRPRTTSFRVPRAEG